MTTHWHRFLFAGFTLVALTARPQAADFSRGARGTSAATFLARPVDARSAALGGAATASAEGPDALSLNPSALTRTTGWSAALTHAPESEAASLQQAAFALRRGAWVVAAGTRLRTAGRMDETDLVGTTRGTFRPNDAAYILGAARRWGTVALGAAGKMIRSTLKESAQTTAADLGALWTPSERWAFGMTVANLGGGLTYDRTSEPLPFAVTVGAEHRRGGWRFAADAVAPRDNAPFLALGVERRWTLPAAGDWALRAGYDGRAAGDAGGAQGVTMGLGWRFRCLALDYAFLPAGDLGDAHRLTLGWKY